MSRDRTVRVGLAVVLAAGSVAAMAAWPGGVAGAAAPSGASVFRATPVDRVFDTRTGSGGVTPAGVPAAAATFYDVAVPGCPDDATAVALNVTATEAAGGFVGVYPGGTRTVSTSLLNPNPGGTRANFTIVPFGPGRTVTLYSQQQAHLLADRFGCMVPASPDGEAAGRFVPVTPGLSPRAVDTRLPSLGTTGRRTAGSVTRIPLTTPGAFSAVALTVTVDGPSAPGWLAVAPGGTFSFANPTSNVNFVAGEARAAVAIVPLAADGTVDVAVSQDTHVLIDLAGFFTTDQALATLDGVYLPSTQRLYDSRASVGLVAPSTSVDVALPALPHAPGAVLVNYTADQAAGPGYLSGWSGPTWTLGSNVNYDAGETSPSAGITPISPVTADLKVRAGVSAAAVVVDLMGYFADLPVRIGSTDAFTLEASVATAVNVVRSGAGRSTPPLVRSSTSRACAQQVARETLTVWDTVASPYQQQGCPDGLSFANPPGLALSGRAIGYGTDVADIVTQLQGWRNEPASILAEAVQQEVGCFPSRSEPGRIWCALFLFRAL